MTLTPRNRPLHQALPRTLDLDSDLDVAGTLAVALSRVENGLVFGAYAVPALVAGTVPMHRGDTT